MELVSTDGEPHFVSKQLFIESVFQENFISNMIVGFDSSSDEEEPLFNMEDVERRTFDKDKDLPLWKRFLNTLKKLGEDRNSLKSTICYCGVFMVFGMSDEILGPTLLELKCLTGKSITVMSVLFFVHDLCNVFGSTSGGYLVDR